MENQNKKLTRQEYNRQYYQQNREKLLKKKKDPNQLEIEREIPCSKPGEIPISPSARPNTISRVIRALELTALIVLTVAMTVWLINESAGFYLDANESAVSAYVKAGMIELTAVLFSFSRSRNFMIQWGQRAILVLLCGLSLFTMSQRVVKNASTDTAKAQASLNIIRELEAERTQKEILREQFLKKGLLTMTRRYEKGLEQVREKLIAAQQSLPSTHTSKVIVNGLGVMILFRLALLVSNLICLHRIAEFFTGEPLRYQRE